MKHLRFKIKKKKKPLKVKKKEKKKGCSWMFEFATICDVYIWVYILKM